ncbi:MAG: sugar nucleotide-binding protein [Thermoguttaceae bacterium]|nr:sugar nucleotide-binding protein [Thermoguttaceae bacterium]
MSRNPATYRQILQECRRQVDSPYRAAAKTPLPLVITGVTGVAGYGALAYFQSRFPEEVYGVVQETDVDFPAPNLIYTNLRDYEVMARLFDGVGARAILDCAGNCALKACQVDPRIAWELNVDIVRNLARYARERAIRLVHLSVDMVFKGRPRGAYRDDEPTCPANVYGESMVEGERAVAEIDPYAATLRISMPMGVSFNGHAGAIDWIAARFRPNRPATLYYNEVRTPTYVDEMARVFREFLANDYAGVLNCGGARQVSLYQMAQIINRTGGFNPELLYGMRIEESCPVPPRVRNCSLDSSKLADILGYPPFTPWPANPNHLPDSKSWHYDRRPNEPGSTPYMNRVLAFSPTLYPEGSAYLDNLF